MWIVFLELAPWLLLGAGVAGILHVLLPSDFLRHQLTGYGGVVKAVGLGVPLPLCSCGVIPVGLGLKKGGASDGAAVGFLISTPQTGVDSILVSASFLGWPFAAFKVFSAAVTGVIGGWVTHAMSNSSAESECSPLDAAGDDQQGRSRNWLAALCGHSLMLIRTIWGWLVVGIVASAAIHVFVPESAFAGLSAYGGLTAMLVTLLISIPLYVCATASVPIAAALVASGLPTGAALVFLMAGPATNVATLGAVYRTLGVRALGVYLATVVIGSIGLGWAFGFVISTDAAMIPHEHVTTTWWSVASAVILLVLIAWFAVQDVARFFKRRSVGVSDEPKLEIAVEGMTCNGCVAKLERVLTSDSDIDAVIVTLKPGRAIIQGDVSKTRARELIEQAGFQSGECSN